MVSNEELYTEAQPKSLFREMKHRKLQLFGIDRGRYLKVGGGGSKWGEMNAVLGRGYRRGRFLTQRELTPGKFGKFYVQDGAFWGQIALVLIVSKLQF